jgi:hypothetical protein
MQRSADKHGSGTRGTKLLYKPLGLIVGAFGGMVASAAFKRVWKAVDAGQEAPSPTEEDSSWGTVLAAAALQGVIFAVVRAAVDRAGATGVRRLTGRWPA